MTEGRTDGQESISVASWSAVQGTAMAVSPSSCSGDSHLAITLDPGATPFIGIDLPLSF